MNNRVAIITGGGRGIGRAISQRLAKDCAVLVVGRTESDLQSVANEIQSAGGNCHYCVGDISKPASADRCLRIVRRNEWILDSLVCNAGIASGGNSETFDRKLFRRAVNVNLLGNFWFMQACISRMLEQEQGGSICVIGSILGVKGYGHQAAYCATKHALVGLSKSLGLEYAKQGISVYPLCMSFVESEMTDRTIHGIMERETISLDAATARVAAKNPQKRIIPAQEVAEMVAFLCSRKVPSLNANSLIMSGGE